MESTVDPNRLIPLNVAEAIIDPFHENLFSIVDRYRFTDLLPDWSSWAQKWHFPDMRFDVRDGDALLGALSRRYAIDASGYDRFILRISLSANVRAIALLTVDGVTQKAVDAPGAGGFHEVSGPGPVTVLWNTTGTVEALGRGYRIAAENAIADIEPEWVPARIGIEGNLYNAVQESCRVLMPEAPPAAQHRLATRIRVSRSA